jgi:hypothetical protein
MSLAQVAAAGDATLDDFLERLDADLALNVHVGIAESDPYPGFVIRSHPCTNPCRLTPHGSARHLVRYPTSLTEIYEIVRRLDAEQIREWEEQGDADLGADVGAPSIEPPDRGQ